MRAAPPAARYTTEYRTNGPELTLLTWALAAIPIVLLIATILRLKWSAPRAGGVAWLVAVALLVFGGAPEHVAIASAKGLTLAVFVLPIVWTSVFMFNMVDKLKAIDAIGRVGGPAGGTRPIRGRRGRGETIS